MTDLVFSYPKSDRKVVNPRRITSTAEYRIWTSMKARCSNPKHKDWDHYGGKGITVCPRWVESFWNFYGDTGPRPSHKHSLERMDGSRGYEPGNCCWATQAEQLKNTSQNVSITAFGKTQILMDWARETKIPYQVLRYRLSREWEPEDALSIPYKKREKLQKEKKPPRLPRALTVDGRTMTVAEWATELGVDPAVIHNRLKIGWRPEDAVSTTTWGSRGKGAMNGGKKRGCKPSVVVTAFGVTKLLVEWALEYDFPPSVLNCRLKLGWSPEKALTTKVRKKRSSKK